MTSNKNNLAHSRDYSPDHFPCGILVTDASRIITYVNNYFLTELLWEPETLLGKSTDDIFTRSSVIFCQSYLIPTLLHENKCEEMQLIIFNGKRERIPITVNAKSASNGAIYWSFFTAVKRDKLYDELIKARESLEEQAQKLALLASTDELTGLLNRREMKHRSALALEQAARFGHPVALVMLDIDYFKKINDTFGHLEGDKVLKELGDLLKSSGRQTDLVSRFGGEEFIFLLPEINEQDALFFCQRLHKLTAQVLVGGIPLAASIGVSVHEGKISFKDMYTQVDTALYQAKNLGRNRTEIYRGDQ